MADARPTLIRRHPSRECLRLVSWGIKAPRTANATAGCYRCAACGRAHAASLDPWAADWLNSPCPTHRTLTFARTAPAHPGQRAVWREPIPRKANR